MNNRVIAIPAPNGVTSILNFNRVASEKIKEAIRSMGMSACQARCLNCNKCACHAGK